MSNQCGCGNESNVFTEKEVESKVRKTEKPELLKKLESPHSLLKKSVMIQETKNNNYLQYIVVLLVLLIIFISLMKHCKN
jgi:hypothetical protein